MFAPKRIPGTRIVDWNEYAHLIQKLADAIELRKKYQDLKNIFYFSEGGGIMALSLSGKLHLPYTDKREEVTKDTVIVCEVS